MFNNLKKLFILEPQLPPRPTNSSIQDSKNAFITWGRLTSVEAELWNYVPPAPKDGDTDRSNNHQQQSMIAVPSHQPQPQQQFNLPNDDNHYVDHYPMPMIMPQHHSPTSLSSLWLSVDDNRGHCH